MSNLSDITIERNVIEVGNVEGSIADWGDYTYKDMTFSLNSGPTTSGANRIRVTGTCNVGWASTQTLYDGQVGLIYLRGNLTELYCGNFPQTNNYPTTTVNLSGSVDYVELQAGDMPQLVDFTSNQTTPIEVKVNWGAVNGIITNINVQNVSSVILDAPIVNDIGSYEKYVNLYANNCTDVDLTSMVRLNSHPYQIYEIHCADPTPTFTDDIWLEGGNLQGTVILSAPVTSAWVNNFLFRLIDNSDYLAGDIYASLTLGNVSAQPPTGVACHYLYLLRVIGQVSITINGTMEAAQIDSTGKAEINTVYGRVGTSNGKGVYSTSDSDVDAPTIRWNSSPARWEIYFEEALYYYHTGNTTYPWETVGAWTVSQSGPAPTSVGHYST